MAADKGESGSVQAADASKQTKKPRTTVLKKKSLTLAERTIAEAKTAYKDIDLSDGRKLRKRDAAPVTKKSAPKKAATKVAKKAAAPKKSAKSAEDTKATKASASKGE